VEQEAASRRERATMKTRYKEIPVVKRMTARRVVLLLSAAAISISWGCGGGNTANVQNPPPPATQHVSIAFQSAPAASLPLGTTAAVSAVVTNDPGNAGVDWAVTCQNTGNCGSISPHHTASGDTATYSPPTVLSGNSQNVNIEAFATADHTQNVIAATTITG